MGYYVREKKDANASGLKTNGAGGKDASLEEPVLSSVFDRDIGRTG